MISAALMTCSAFGNLEEWPDKAELVSAIANGPDLGDRGCTLLQLACARGNMRNVRFLLAYGVNIDEFDTNYATALSYAVATNHVEIARTLLDAGAVMCSSGYAYGCVMCNALKCDHPDAVSLLLDYGYKMPITFHKTYITPKWALRLAEGRERARKMALLVMGIIRAPVPRDVRTLLGKYIWATRSAEGWKETTRSRTRVKK